MPFTLLCLIYAAEKPKQNYIYFALCQQKCKKNHRPARTKKNSLAQRRKQRCTVAELHGRLELHRRRSARCTAEPTQYHSE